MTHSATLIPAPSGLSPEAFVDEYGGLYEHSPWVAQRVAGEIGSGELDTVARLHQALSEAMLAASEEEQMQLVRAHPDLATRAAVTADSASEQASVGLDQCTAAEFSRFTELNDAYKQRFGFPFIMAVRGSNRHLILEAFERRISHEPRHEFLTALAEINKIALFRLFQRFT